MNGEIAIVVDEGDQESSHVERAIDRAREHEATLHGLYVIDAWRFGEYSAYGWSVLEREKQEEKGERVLERIREKCEQHGVEFEQETTVGKPNETIRDFVRDNDIDLLVFCESGGEGKPHNSPQMIRDLQRELSVEIETV
ncbi:universal stress protein [Halapricum hydrolyticum]|uniref:Universal stress protein n=1 Tax=Halapricum hydrolyticum TaxID=2979991 RepID=A0AAE3IDD4_9EURY|nr:universal stress protein [Halapricum hydrolyticum]MCU4719534.1 universal stress protein [Halapricum hydrolyticum]MCU4728182.1 universal stress protein [Halapricum hydrolyticum]